MKRVLLLATWDEGLEARFETAVRIVRALGGHLICVDGTFSALRSGELIFGAEQNGIVEAERDTADRNRFVLEQRMRDEALKWDWIEAEADVTAKVIQTSLLCDLIVLSRLGHDPLLDPSSRLGRILMHTRVPLIVLPDPSEALDLDGTALVAWDGKEAAAATLKACAPLLELASHVEIFSVRGKALQCGGSAAAAYLADYKIDARVSNAASGSVPAAIEAEAEARRCAYILMGAYSHGRAAGLFGGATHELLGSCSLPLLIGR